ncbi:hypothetical protein MTO96_021898 [Rhipicephalus appendiculatus]
MCNALRETVLQRTLARSTVVVICAIAPNKASAQRVCSAEKLLRMDVFNRLRSTVSNLSTVLPGNPVTREYEVIKHVGSAGPGLLWKIFQATKRSTKEEAAVFVLEKKQLDRYSKRDREHVMELLKQGVAQLTRLRHPSILTCSASDGRIKGKSGVRNRASIL